MATILLIATLDTKGEELAYVRDLIHARGHGTRVMDAGVLGEPRFRPDVTAAEVAWAGGTTVVELRRQGDRGVALEVMARGAAAVAINEHAERRVDAVLGLGGSCGTAIATAAMRALPIGLPRVMVSTVASGHVGSYVGVTDITMMYSVVDVAGLNRVTRRILSNAAGAVCGMVEQAAVVGGDRPLVAATMFGVTTPCVERVRKHLEAAGWEVLVFHATGSGGRAMEGLITSGFIAGVADVTTTEWCDELVGGVLSAGPERLEAAGRVGIPQVVSCGALDMVNFGPKETVPEQFRRRRLHVHNPSVTLMRTTAEECGRLGEIIAGKLNAARGPTTLVLPLRGVSALDREGQPFHDPEADGALFEALRRAVGPLVTLVELDHHINDPPFADALAERLVAQLSERAHAVPIA
ncbi:MAG: Tm-1-like ATP-binding domain-containing protein [Longimicrobiales bacterium]